jgi:HNH endonuclease
LATSKVNNQVTQKRLKELLNYDPETGVFTRLSNPLKPTGSSDCTKGYLRIAIDRVRYKSHRLAYLYMTGEWPAQVVDHINGIKYDNRWCNLRAATLSENGCNRSVVNKNNKLGLRGVSQVSKNTYQVIISVGGRRECLYGFDCPHKAAEAYLQKLKTYEKTKV